MVRIGRFLSNWGRLDVPNDMQSNGELSVLDSVIKTADHSQHHVFVDAGANVGDWTIALLNACGRYRLQSFTVHSFEPHPATFTTLRRRVEEHPLANRVKFFPLALSEQNQTTPLFVVGDNAGTNSLHQTETSQSSLTVQTVSLDSHAREHGFDRILYMKVDTEGHDMRVLNGASRLLRDTQVIALQFEYNYRWILGRNYLKDVFDLLSDGSYSIGKITPLGIEVYPKWHPELETFREGNYLVCQPRILPSLPLIDWWNEV
jgi:FkbM family methyltransferase